MKFHIDDCCSLANRYPCILIVDEVSFFFEYNFYRFNIPFSKILAFRSFLLGRDECLPGIHQSQLFTMSLEAIQILQKGYKEWLFKYKCYHGWMCNKSW